LREGQPSHEVQITGTKNALWEAFLDTSGLSQPDEVKPVRNEECVRLFLYTAEDFQFFHNAVTETLQSIKWLGGAPEDDQEETEEF
jgi:hypothetical protein